MVQKRNKYERNPGFKENSVSYRTLSYKQTKVAVHLWMLHTHEHFNIYKALTYRFVLSEAIPDQTKRLTIEHFYKDIKNQLVYMIRLKMRLKDIKYFY